MTESWAEYLQRVTRGVERKDIAAAAGIDVSGISRWITGSNRPDAERVVRFARAFHRPPLEALVAAGYLEPEEVNAEVVCVDVRAMPTEELMAELSRRLAQRMER
jgi:transcriptional regulator with XRE-family HTH domain